MDGRTRGAKGGVGLAHKVPSSSHFVGFCSVCPLALPPSSVEQSDPPPPPHQPPPTASFVLIAPGEMTHTDTDATRTRTRTDGPTLILLRCLSPGKLIRQIEYYISAAAVGHVADRGGGEQVQGEEVLASKDENLLLHV